MSSAQVTEVKNILARLRLKQFVHAEEAEATAEKIGAYAHVLRVPGDKNIPGSAFIRHHNEHYGCSAGNCPPSMPVFPSQTD